MKKCPSRSAFQTERWCSGAQSYIAAAFKKFQNAEHKNTRRYHGRKIVCMQGPEVEQTAGHRQHKSASQSPRHTKKNAATAFPFSQPFRAVAP
jgi:hypothetical protein